MGGFNEMPAENPDYSDDRLRQPEVAENVRALLGTVRHLLAEESSRDQSFNTRGVGVAGFVAIVVSLSASLGHDALSSGWGSPWQEIGVGLFALALVALLASVVAVVAIVLRPQEASSLGIGEVKKFSLPEHVYAPRVMNEGRIMRGLIEMLVIERERGNKKAKGLRWCYALLIVGLTAISILGFLLGLHDANLIGARDGQRSPPAVFCVGPDIDRQARPGAASGRHIPSPPPLAGRHRKEDQAPMIGRRSGSRNFGWCLRHA